MSTSSPSPTPAPPVPLHGAGALHPFETPPLPPGTRIGGDVVEGVLGRGGFAIVYRVRSPEGRLFALKLLPLEEDPVRAERAWRELSLGTRLRHPNLGRQVGAGQWPEDKPRYLWLKLELIEGPTLDAWGLEPGRTVGEVVERVLEVVRGLAVVHEARVVHRDVKEANILVRQSTGQAVLVDFGVGYHEGGPHADEGDVSPGHAALPGPRGVGLWPCARGRARGSLPGGRWR